MAFPIDPGRPPGIQPLEDQVPDQGNVDPRAMLPLANVREQQHHDVRQHAVLGHGHHDDQDMNLEDMLPLRQAFNLDQDDAMLEDGNDQLQTEERTSLMNCMTYANIELMDTFHDIVEPDFDVAQTLCDLQWAPPTRHVVLNEELTDIGLDPEEDGNIRQNNQRQSVAWILFEQAPGRPIWLSWNGSPRITSRGR